MTSPSAELTEVLGHNTGARFYRADLHIHSFGGSHDVRDATMTPDAIVATAVRENLSVIAIADHNEINNVEPAMRAGNAANILIIPGIELSTPQGHLLCYLPNLEALQRFHGMLTFADRGTANSRCQQSVLECLRIVETLSGFAILAHVDIDSGFEVEQPGASPHKFDIICHRALLGIELKHAASDISYGTNDTNPDRARMGQKRIELLGLGAKQNLARVLNSDAHTLHSLGRNAENVRRVTRYKMDAPSFSALKIALEDADARVRIEDLIPQNVPQIIGLKANGGFLNGQAIQFSPNLNCIIGGRGTGKSTTFEAIRCLADGHSDSKVIDCEIWPDELHLFWQDRAGRKNTLYRPKNGELQNVDDPENGPHKFEIDCFGQGDAARISIQAQTNPLALLNYLDKFIDLEAALAAEAATRDKLLDLQAEIEKAEIKVQRIPQLESLLTTTQQQLAALQKPEVKELIDLQRELAGEKEIRTQLLQSLRESKDEAGSFGLKDCIDKFKEIADPASLTVGAEEFQAILAGAAVFEGTVETAEAQIIASLTTFEQVILTHIAAWKSKESDAQKKIDIKKRELEALNVSFDMSYIAKLAADEASYSQSVRNLKTWKPHLAQKKRERATALSERWVTRERVATLRDTFGRKASATLQEALSDLQVSLKYSRNAYSPDATEQIIAVMDWRTNQQIKAKWLVEQLTVPKLLDALNRNDASQLTALKTEEGVQVFKADEAAIILQKLREPSVKYILERAALHDLPRLQITRGITDESGSIRYIQRDFSKLSLGQQQSVLLALILSADSNRPLIIDQPEDNLDGEFIYSTLVPVLRMAKERRQVIIVTHNANVAVLGDAELIIVLKAFNDRASVVSRGSIDHAETREAACAILEGAKEAFFRRAKMYGIQIVS